MSRTFPYSILKISSKWIKDLNLRLETIKLIEENTGRTHFNINYSNISWGKSSKPKEIKTKTDKWRLIKLKNFCTIKETINSVKRQPTEWMKYW